MWKMITTINLLHEQNLTHLDIRLDNICYDEKYNPILIDLDRAMPTNRWNSRCVYPNSVMYRHSIEFKGEEQYWLQLACIILWVLTEEQQPKRGESSAYHKQTISIQHDLVKDMFFLKLFNKGKGKDI